MKGRSIVYTESTCGRCGCVKRVEGLEGALPPVGWSEMQLTKRLEGSGWTRSERLVNTILCPECAAHVQKEAKS